MHTILLSFIVLLYTGMFMSKEKVEDCTNVFSVVFRIENRINGLQILKEMDVKAKERNITGFLLDSRLEDVLFGCIESDNQTFEELTSWMVSAAGRHAKLVIRECKYYGFRVYTAFGTRVSQATWQNVQSLIDQVRAVKVPLDAREALGHINCSNPHNGRVVHLDPIKLPV